MSVDAPEPAPAPDPDADPDEAPPARTRQLVAPLALAVGVGLVGVLLLLRYRLFRIPAGPMAPTLIGRHYAFDCDACGVPLRVGAQAGPPGLPVTVRTDCTSCGEEVEVDDPEPSSGQRILALRGTDPPGRWEIATFDFPRDRAKQFASRAVGLPGETLSVANGNLFVDGALVAKPDAVQAGAWVFLHDSRHVLDLAPAGPRWAPEPADARWDVSSAGLVGGADPSSWLVYRGQLADVLSYNGFSGFQPDPVADLRVSAEVLSEQAGTVTLRLDEHASGVARALEARVAIGEPAGPHVELCVAGRAVSTASLPAALTPGEPHVVALSYADQRARVEVGGEQVISWNDPRPPLRQIDGSGVRLQASAWPTRFAWVRIERDLHYVASPGPFDPASRDVVVPAGAYFMLSDNSNNAEDSRAWGFVPADHFTGRVLFGF